MSESKLIGSQEHKLDLILQKLNALQAAHIGQAVQLRDVRSEIKRLDARQLKQYMATTVRQACIGGKLGLSRDDRMAVREAWIRQHPALADDRYWDPESVEQAKQWRLRKEIASAEQAELLRKNRDPAAAVALLKSRAQPAFARQGGPVPPSGTARMPKPANPSSPFGATTMA